MKTRLMIALLVTLFFASGLFAWDFNHRIFYDVSSPYARRFFGSALPATCVKYQTQVNSSDDKLNICTATNTWQSLSYGSTAPGGSNTQVQFNDSSSFGGDSGLTYNKTTDVLTTAGAYVVGTNAASTGSVRLPNNSYIYGRNSGNSADKRLIGVNTDDTVYLGAPGDTLQITSSVFQVIGTFSVNDINIGSGWWYLRQNGDGGIAFGSGHGIYWGSGATNTTGPPSGDTGMGRIAAGVVAFNNGANGSTTGGNIKIGSTVAKPTCDSTTRGYIYHFYGGAGVKDTVETCAKAADDSYAWRVIY